MRHAVLVLAACGRINFGTGGDDDNTDGGIPLQPARAISTGMGTSCAILDDGTLWCWGQFVASGSLVPTQMDPSTDWVEVGSASGGACARKADGTLWCFDGQVSTEMIGPATWTSLAMRDGGGCGINGGAIYCWGESAYGTLGNPSAGDTDTPVPATAPATFDVVAGSSKTMCAIDTAQHVWCWGQNNGGEAGVPGLGNVTAPTQFGTASWRAVATGSVSCGLQIDGTLWCWGGAFGTITQVDARTDWTAIAVGVTSVCAIRNRELWCSGNNWFGQLGAGDAIDRATLTQIDPGDTFTAIAMTAFTSCAIRDGLAACTGHALSGQLGDGAWRFAPGMRTVLGTGWVDFALKEDSTCGRKTDGSIWCWGHSTFGQLGFAGSAPAPRRVGTGTWMDVGASSTTLFAIAPDQMLWTWGLQYPSGVVFTEPMLFDATPAWQHFAGGQTYACAIRSDGSLWCWGTNTRGQLGLGDTTTAPTPTRVDTASYRHIACSVFATTCAIRSDDSLWCWGANTSGAVGDGSTMDRVAPVPIAGSWTDVSVGFVHTCGVQTDGTLWCWGALPNAIVPLLVPTRVGSDSDWASAAAGTRQTCAIKRDRSLWCWGNALSGELPGTSVDTPVRLDAKTDWVTVVEQQYFACAIDAAHNARCWGTNFYGQLGDDSAFATTYRVVVRP